MQVNLDKNRTNFNGNLYISGLNKKQQKVVEQLRPALDELIKNKKNTNLYIEGSMHPNIIARGSKEPKYALMFTQVKTATKPTAESSTSSLSPKKWMNNIKDLLAKHEESDFYKKTVNKSDNKTEGKQNFVQKIKKVINNIFK